MVGVQERERLVPGEAPLFRSEVLGQARRRCDDVREGCRHPEVNARRCAVVGVEDADGTGEPGDVHAGRVAGEDDIGPEATRETPELQVASGQLRTLTDQSAAGPSVYLVWEFGTQQGARA